MKLHQAVVVLGVVVIAASAQQYGRQKQRGEQDSISPNNPTRVNNQVVDRPSISGPQPAVAPTGGSRPIKDIGISNALFTTKLYKELSSQDGNLFFSPLSIHSILTMIYYGASEETANQLQQGLSLHPNKATTLDGYRSLSRALSKSTSKVTLDVANKIYTNKSVLINADYLAKTKPIFNFSTEGTDFSLEEDSRRKINDWVATSTHQNIKDLIPPGLLNAGTLMVLVNAIYFKAFWLTKFEPKNTKPSIFYTHTNEEIQGVPMMTALSEFRYKDNWQENFRVLELPYEGDKVSMVILLPYEYNGLPELEVKIANTNLTSLFEGLDKTNVNVHLPKFTLEKSTDLDETLRSLGMVDMYSSAANFSNLIQNKEKVKVSKVAHKAFIEVSEEGTKAAAATFLAVQTLSLNPDDKADFNANHPFIYIVRHKPTNNVLFIGRFSYPELQ